MREPGCSIAERRSDLQSLDVIPARLLQKTAGFWYLPRRPLATAAPPGEDRQPAATRRCRVRSDAKIRHLENPMLSSACLRGVAVAAALFVVIPGAFAE